MEEDGKAFKKPKTNGRPTKLTPELQDKVCKLVSAGNYIETAAAFVGVSKTSLYDWMKKGNEQKKGIHRNFLNAIEKALAESEIRDNMTISNAANAGAWQAAAWRQERKNALHWGRQERVDMNHSGSIGVKIVDDIPQDNEPEDD